jgi:hypothetical protein
MVSPVAKLSDMQRGIKRAVCFVVLEKKRAKKKHCL